MKKRFFAVVIILIIALFASASYAELPVVSDAVQEIPETVQNRLSIEFHAVSGNDIVTLDLKKYFGRMALFVAGKTQHVNVSIDSLTGIATLSALEPDWRGIEEVVFATSYNYIGDTAAKPKQYLPRYGNLTKLNLSKDKIAIISDAFTQQQFQTLIGNLTGESVEIISFLSENSLALDLNNELTINFSYGPDRKSPHAEIGLGFRFASGNLTAAEYHESNQFIFFSLVMFAMGGVIILFMVLRYTLAEPFKQAFLAPKKQVMSKAGRYKDSLRENLAAIKKQVGKEKPGKLYRETLMQANSFLTKAFGIRGTDIESISLKMEKMGLSSGTKSKIMAYLEDYRSKVYKASSITDEDVQNLISFIDSIARGL